MKLTQEQVEYINDKAEHFRLYGVPVHPIFAEKLIEFNMMSIEKMKNSVFYIIQAMPCDPYHKK